ncbi:MAG TPA: BON domain-containing protein [Desulfotignum sp.]|nr:BON domain-containing protein [Desulfotignum sp.]
MKTDELIKQSVVYELGRDMRVDASKIVVTVYNGRVTLTGEAPTLLGKSAATDAALAILGVVDVDNLIVVKYPSTVRIPTDVEIKENILMKLAGNPDIDVLDLDVTVDAGVVTLRGTVDTYWKRTFLEDLVAPEAGVTFIENHVAVIPTHNVLDKVIAEDIVASLEARANVDADDIEVSVSDGVVELTGSVPDAAARQAAAKAAFHPAGVKMLHNNLVIARP